MAPGIQRRVLLAGSFLVIAGTNGAPALERPLGASTVAWAGGLFRPFTPAEAPAPFSPVAQSLVLVSPADEPPAPAPKSTPAGACPGHDCATPHSPANAKTVTASFYDSGRRTANGEHFEPLGLTAAHPSLPFGTKVRVTNRQTGLSVVVRVNDRGPYWGGRAIDLSRGAARAIGMEKAGVARVEIAVVN